MVEQNDFVDTRFNKMKDRAYGEGNGELLYRVYSLLGSQMRLTPNMQWCAKKMSHSAGQLRMTPLQKQR